MEGKQSAFGLPELLAANRHKCRDRSGGKPLPVSGRECYRLRNINLGKFEESSVELEYQPDVDNVLQRFEAWWQQEIIDRPPLTLRVQPTGPAELPEKKHADWRERWWDIEYQLDAFEARTKRDVFMAETLPIYMPNLGPELCATVFGVELQYSEFSAWSVPIVESCREIPAIEPNLDNPYWNQVRKMTDASLQRGAGKWITGMTDLHTNGDLLASLRDPQELCIEMIEDLAAVGEACLHVTKAYPLMFDDLWGRIKATGQPCTTWTQYLCRGRAYPTSCDFICMVSPEMFQKAILPSIVEEMRFNDRSIFHLDGPGALKHLDALLACPELDALQWVYGAGNGPAANWIEVYQKAQAAGKGVQVFCEGFEDAKTVAAALKPAGAWFSINNVPNAQAAQAIIEWFSRWAAGKEG